MPKIPGPGDVPPVTFRNFVTELASTALVCLGYIKSPVTGERNVDLARAEHVVGLLEMLEEKTRGNLSEDEAAYLRTVIEDLREKLKEIRPEPG